MPPITPFLWFNANAEDAVNFYLSIFPNSKILKTTRYTDAGPGPKGSVMTIAYQLNGVDFTAINGGPHMTMSGAVSFVVHCKDQPEVDHYWSKLGDGAKIHQCAWLTDKFGVTWQIVPDQLVKLLSDPDPAKAQRVMQAMFKMTKIEIAKLEEAYNQS
jgi:predicted 3-demethylubiquinone-9 3-methyltransferase (glyoxalase superfamily)